MSTYRVDYEMVKERQARMIREAEMVRLARSCKQVQSSPSTLKSLLLLILPVH